MNTPQQKAIAPNGSGGDRHNVFSSSTYSSRSSQYQHSGQGSPCPVCSRTKDSDCRWNDEVVLCHSHVDQDAKVPGYIYRGTKDIWGLYFPAVESPPKPLRPKSEKHFIYTDPDGKRLVRVTRKDDGKGKKRIFQSHWDGTKWVKGLTPEIKAQLRLYRIGDPLNQAAIAHGQILLIVEGEGKVDLALGMGIAATCAIGGAGKWRHYGYPSYLEDLKGATIVLCPDRDVPGVKHCLDIEQDFPNAQWLYVYPDSPLWDNLPKKDGLDIVDWVADYKLGAEAVLAAISPKRSLQIEQPVSKDNKDESEEPEKKTIAQLLIEIAEQGSYFHTGADKAYVDLRLDGVRKTFPVRHKTFKLWLQRELYTQFGKMAGSEALSQALGVLEGKACFEGPEQAVHLRIAESGNKVYLDLGTDDWQAIEVDADGWRIVSDSPVRFRRPETLYKLPMPEPGGHLSELRQLLNLDEDGWVLAINWLLFSFYPKFPHPILILHGEQGTGKSYTAKLLKALIDPGKAALIPHVAELRDLAIAAENRWILAYDNLSNLSNRQSDALCRISTGGGFSTRTLYQDDEETVFEFVRPQILTGIDELASRGDLLERSLMVELQRIPPEERLTESELEEHLDRLQGRILGALLDALSQTLKQWPLVEADRLPRMADFARFAIAAETALDLPVGSFLRVYTGNRQSAHEAAVESSPVAVAIMRLMDRQPVWEGTSTDLLKDLEGLTDDNTRKKRNWAGSPKALGRALKRLAPDLLGVGIELSYPARRSSQRSLRLERVAEQMSQTSLTSPSSQGEGLGNDVEPLGYVSPHPANVTDDKTRPPKGAQGSQVTANVTAEAVTPQGLQPCHDNHDVCDKQTVTYSNCGEWVFHRGMNTQVELVSLNQATAKVRVPGMGMRNASVDDLEVLNNGAA